MADEKKGCQNGPCKCHTKAGEPYCSEYCEQASSHAIERDFCECGHPECDKPRKQ